MAESANKRPRVVLTGRREDPKANAMYGTAAAAPVAKAALQKETPAHREVKREPPKAAPPPPAAPKAGGQAPQAAASRPKLPELGPIAVFDVCGKIFKFPAQTIKAKPETLLARVLEDAGTTGPTSKPIFVDSAPDRFTYILDWYRHGEVHIPRGVCLESLLLDARTLHLPSEIIVNGVSRSTAASSGPGAARKVARGLLADVERRWQGFDRFLDRTMNSIAAHFRQVGEGAHISEEAFESYDFVPFLLPLYGEQGWLDGQHVCSGARARVLALRLEERGYRCEFSDTELVVHLPLRLQGEALGGMGADGDEPGEEEPVLAQGPGGEGGGH